MNISISQKTLMKLNETIKLSSYFGEMYENKQQRNNTRRTTLSVLPTYGFIIYIFFTEVPHNYF